MRIDDDSGPATLNEIYSQARSCEQTIALASSRLEMLKPLLPIEDYSDILITGCGSSHNLAMCASFAWSDMLGRPVAAIASSELMHFPEHYLARGARPLVIAITRSGGTTEVRLAVERLRREYGARALAMTGEPGGSVAHVCDAEIAFSECYERSVVMTQAFTCMLAGFYLLADGLTGGRRFEELSRMPQLIADSLGETEQIVRPLADDERISRFYFLGSGPMKGLADECALKMTEMALDQAVSHRSLEFRHGPKASLDSSAQVVVFPVAAEAPHLDTLLAEIGATEARSLLVEQAAAGPTGPHALAIKGELSEIFRPALYAHIGQMLAYWRAEARDMNPDAPPHLARTVKLDV